MAKIEEILSSVNGVRRLPSAGEGRAGVPGWE